MKKFGVFGNPIKHSLSPLLHNFTIKNLNLDAFYGRILLKDPTKLKDKFLNLKLSSANITIPHKNTAFLICDFKDDISKKLEVCNTIVFKKNKFYGFNTDYLGFLKTLNLKNIKKALILGAGNTTKTISYALRDNNIEVNILSHNQNKWQYFRDFSFFIPTNLKDDNFDIIINTTPAGMSDNNLPFDKEILDPLIKKTNIIYDVIYNKMTPFLKLGKFYNKTIIDGKNMLINQAAIAFNIFYDYKFDEKEIIRYMQEAIKLG